MREWERKWFDKKWLEHDISVGDDVVVPWEAVSFRYRFLQTDRWRWFGEG